MSLPDDLVVDILKRLPLKSVKRASCVSKLWYALTSTPEFLRSMHLHNFYHSDDDGGGVSYLIAGSVDHNTGMAHISILSPPHEDDCDRVDVITTVTHRDSPLRLLYDDNNLAKTHLLSRIYPFVSGDNDDRVPDDDKIKYLAQLGDSYTQFRRIRTQPRLLGPVNGVVCVSSGTDMFALWTPNPNSSSSSSSSSAGNVDIGDFKLLPASQIRRPGDLDLFGVPGFGCSDGDQYKVVQILLGLKKRELRQVEIYESRADSWRKIDVCPPVSPSSQARVCHVYATLKKSIVCWLGSASNPRLLLSFDLCTEEFQITHFPPDVIVPADELVHLEGFARGIFSFNDCIALVDFRDPATSRYRSEMFPQPTIDQTFDIWVLNEIGVVESWAKLLRIGPLSDIARPLGFWVDGRFLFQDDYGNIVCHDSRRSQQLTTDFGFQARPMWMNLISCKFNYRGRCD